MPINHVIHDKRKELGLTQEQVAAYLGVSAPAVNKWEKGSTYPDITLLPALARLLKVDLNTLLCFQEELSKQEIHHLGDEAAKLIRTEGLDAGIRMMSQKIQEYPRCTELIHMFALMADGALIMSEFSTEEKKTYEEKILSWYRRVADSDNEKEKISGAYMLAAKYMHRKEFDKAQEMIDLLPEHNAIDKHVIQADLYMLQKKEENLAKAAELLQRKLLAMIMEISGILNRMVKIDLAAGNEKKAEQIADLAGNVVKAMELWDYYAYISPLDIALAKKDIPESIKLIDALLSSLWKPWDMKNSLLYDQIAKNYDPGTTSASILPPLLAQLEKEPEYEFLRGNGEFEALIEKYRMKM